MPPLPESEEKVKVNYKDVFLAAVRDKNHILKKIPTALWSTPLKNCVPGLPTRSNRDWDTPFRAFGTAADVWETAGTADVWGTVEFSWDVGSL